MIKLKKAVVILFLLIIAMMGYAYGVYVGVFQLNQPSQIQYPIRGVDVSHYQGEIDWDVASTQGIQFAFIKATEGSSHIDPKFQDNWMKAQATDLKIGAYHFFSFDSEGKTQAENYLSVVVPFEGMLPPVVDVEFYADKKQNPPSVENVQRELQIYLDRVEEQCQMKPIIYTTEDVWEIYIKDAFADYSLWIRNVIRKPRLKGEPWLFWQYSNRGKMSGYKGSEPFIDMNVFNGSDEEWSEFLSFN